MGVGTLLLVVAIILFILAALPIPSPVNLQAAGLAFLAASFLVG